MRFPLVALGTLSIVVLAFGCSSSGSSGGGGGGGQGLPPPNPTPPPIVTNPDGIAYPVANLGYQARNGSTPGNVIRNYAFYGYPLLTIPNSTKASAGDLKNVSLADLFDPQQKRYKLIHLSV